MDVIQAIKQRSCIRAYLDKAVPTSLIENVLDAAKQAPSGANTQPWHVAIVTGDSKENITNTLLAERQAQKPEAPDYQYYPLDWFEPYKSRRFDCGMALYQALNIQREDKEKRLEVWNDNYRFFGAPVGLLFFVEKSMQKGSWVDCGMFIQNVMLAAIGYGLGTCPQASLADYPKEIRQCLGMSDEYQLICGMSLGFPDLEHPINQYRVERAAVSSFSHWYA